MLKIAWSENFAHPLPKNHRFPMEKYDLLPEQLLYEGTVNHSNFFRPHLLEERYILNTHDASYWEKLKKLTLSKSEIRKTGFPLSAQLVEREITIAQGTIQAACFALEFGVAMNSAGGTHHAFTNRGEGFCLLNDQAIGSNYLLEHQLARRILIIDLDVHQGNGTAEIFYGNSNVFTFSVHGEKNYPLHKETSDLDIPLPDHTDDKTYLKIVENHLNQVLDEYQPDFIFYQAGVDVLQTDKLGRLAMTIPGCKARDRMVLQKCKDLKVPLMVSMGGGYSDRLAHIIEAHANTFRVAQEIFF